MYGLKQIVLSNKCGDVYNPKVIRSTMGAIFRVNTIKSNDLAKDIETLKKKGYTIVATDLKTDDTIYNIDYKKTVIIIGNEANGVSEEVLNLADKRVKIPMIGKTESLNASVATGVILYEYVRRRLQSE